MTERNWAVLRLSLGSAQMFVAVVAGVLLLQTGVNPYSLTAGIIACGLTTISVLLFGSRRNGTKPNG